MNPSKHGGKIMYILIIYDIKSIPKNLSNMDTKFSFRRRNYQNRIQTHKRQINTTHRPK